MKLVALFFLATVAAFAADKPVEQSTQTENRSTTAPSASAAVTPTPSFDARLLKLEQDRLTRQSIRNTQRYEAQQRARDVQTQRQVDRLRAKK
jgi:hypothetical protein